MDADTLAWVSKLSRLIRAGAHIPFDFVVEHPDSDLAAAWRAPVVPVSATFSTEYLFQIASWVDRRASSDILRRHVEAIASHWRDENKLGAAMDEALAAVNTPGAGLAATRLELFSMSPSAYAGHDIDRMVKGLVRLLEGDLGSAVYNLCDAYSWISTETSAKLRERRGLQFAKQLAIELRKRVATPTWAVLLRDAR